MEEEEKEGVVAWKGNTTAILGWRSGAQCNNFESVSFSGRTPPGAILDIKHYCQFWLLRGHKSAATSTKNSVTVQSACPTCTADRNIAESEIGSFDRLASRPHKECDKSPLSTSTHL